MGHQISEITRRDLWEALSNVRWSGRLDEIEFLSRLYRVNELPSTDPRCRSAADDIRQHRLANDDWGDAWIFTDERFGLVTGEDETILRFLSEMLHPAVRKGDEAARLATVINGLLRADGYQIAQSGMVSGRPIYGWENIDPATAPVDAHFTSNVAPLIATVLELANHDGSDVEREVMRTARARLEEPEYDNLNGGTYYYTLTLVVPVPVFARLGNRVSTLEQRITQRIEQVQRAPDRHHITAVVIQPGQVAAGNSKELSKLIADRSDRAVPQFWTPGQFRLFLSHVTSFRQRTAALRHTLSRYHISAFVAHDAIEPGELWQREIEAALKSMDAMVALLTSGFHESKWTDQEVGWALGRGIYVLPVRKGLDPYGFIGEVQGVQGDNKTVGAVADGIFQALLRHPQTEERMRVALVVGFENSASAEDAASNFALLQRARSFPSSLFHRIKAAESKNIHIAASNLTDRLKRLTVQTSTTT